jgi:sulfatase maturation enzyme AslB (radical SAM superfamily)
MQGDRRGPLAPAESWPSVVGDKPFALDASSLDLFRLTPELAVAIQSAGPEVLGVRKAPVFRPPRAEDPPCQQLVLNLTHHCNLACRYCFVREQSTKREDRTWAMPFELAQAGATS